MSSAVFPGTLAAMPGLGWNVSKSPSFNTIKQTSVGGSELRASFTPYPRWTWTLKYNWLQGGSAASAFEVLTAFYLARSGAYDSFLYEDPTDYSVTDQAFGVGDGADTTFQLYRGLGSFVEPIYNVTTITAIKVATVPTAAYTQSGGVITFTAPPASLAALTWSGTYRWRVRFADDSATFEEFANNFWLNNSVSFISILGS